jgi:hypothetical protein
VTFAAQADAQADLAAGLRYSYDFNNDGTSDVLLRNSTTGDVGYWQINNGQL